MNYTSTLINQKWISFKNTHKRLQANTIHKPHRFIVEELECTMGMREYGRKKRKEISEEIYRIMITAYEFIKNHAEDMDEENDRLRAELESMAATMGNLRGQIDDATTMRDHHAEERANLQREVEHWKERYRNKIYAND